MARPRGVATPWTSLRGASGAAGAYAKHRPMQRPAIVRAREFVASFVAWGGVGGGLRRQGGGVGRRYAARDGLHLSGAAEGKQPALVRAVRVTGLPVRLAI